MVLELQWLRTTNYTHIAQAMSATGQGIVNLNIRKETLVVAIAPNENVDDGGPTQMTREPPVKTKLA